jgi:hypothetical protein
MCGSTSDEQIRGIDKESMRSSQEAAEMFTNDSVKAEVSYRKERLTRDFRRTRKTGTRRHLIHLFTKNV